MSDDDTITIETTRKRSPKRSHEQQLRDRRDAIAAKLAPMSQLKRELAAIELLVATYDSLAKEPPSE